MCTQCSRPCVMSHGWFQILSLISRGLDTSDSLSWDLFSLVAVVGTAWGFSELVAAEENTIWGETNCLLPSVYHQRWAETSPRKVNNLYYRTPLSTRSFSFLGHSRERLLSAQITSFIVGGPLPLMFSTLCGFHPLPLPRKPHMAHLPCTLFLHCNNRSVSENDVTTWLGALPPRGPRVLHQSPSPLPSGIIPNLLLSSPAACPSITVFTRSS